MNLVSTFIVEIRSMGKAPVYFTTLNTTLQLSVAYNQEHSVTVLANNCIGNSTSANLSLLISKQILSESILTYTCTVVNFASYAWSS